MIKSAHAAFAVIMMVTSVAAVAAVDQAIQKPAFPQLPRGYLDHPAPADSIALSPAPPAPGSPAEARDIAASQAGLALRGSARWDLATSDAAIFSPAITTAFSCAAGREIDPQATPATAYLLRGTLTDFGLSTSVIKSTYQRTRPFVVNGQPICTPDQEPLLRHNGSYPSGHSAIGYGWALILAELLPDRADALVARGRAFGDSRRICNVHWLSDIEEGRIAAATVTARLHANPRFEQDLSAARAELATVPAKPPGRDCAAEAAALALTPTTSPTRRRRHHD